LKPSFPICSCFSESMQQQRIARPAQDLGASTERCFPERPNEPNCMYYIRTGQCAYAMNCKFNHPSDRKLVLLASILSL
jgi:hypothetical protein